MSESPQREDSPGAPEKQPKDRYPRMILVCIGISMSLFFVILITLLVDFALRSETDAPEEHPEAFQMLLEQPRPANQQQP